MNIIFVEMYRKFKIEEIQIYFLFLNFLNFLTEVRITLILSDVDMKSKDVYVNKPNCRIWSEEQPETF